MCRADRRKRRKLNAPAKAVTEHGHLAGMKATSRFPNRPDIDGLRAIAVLSVFLYHLEVPPFGGGFVGVDLFFVISGYLISRIVLTDVERGRFSIALFYERRIRRLAPAGIVTVIGTLLI